MSDHDLILGKMEEFKSWAKSHFDLLEKKIDHLEKEMQLFSLFKSKIYWSVSLSSFFIIGFIEIIKTLHDLGGK